jgi:transposase
MNMLRKEEKQLSFYSAVYEKIPETHLLKRIEKAVDFSFINELLADSYCKNNGRPAKEPEMMMKLLFLQYIYTLSDVKVIEESTYNLAFLWFLGLNPEEKLPDASLLAKFRTQRLREYSLDDIIVEIVRQCVDNGVIKSGSVSIDTTHIEANTVKKVPERIMKHLAKRIFNGLEKDLGSIPSQIDSEIPDYKKIEDHATAKQVMKRYLDDPVPWCGEKCPGYPNVNGGKGTYDKLTCCSDIKQSGLKSKSHRETGEDQRGGKV